MRNVVRRASLPGLIVSVLLFAYSEWQAWHLTVVTTRTALERDVEVAASLVENRVIDGIKLLNTVNHELHHEFSGKSLSPELISSALNKAYNAYQMTSDLSPYGIVHVVDRDGVVIASSDPNVRLPVSIADRYYFRALKENPSQRFLVGPTVLSRTTSRLVFHIAEPLSNESPSFQGILVLHGLEEELVKSLKAVMGTATLLEVTSRNNELIAQFPHTPNFYNREHGVLGQLEKIFKQEASHEGDHDWILATSSSPTLGLKVYAAVSRASIFSQYVQEHSVAYILAALCLLIAIVWYRSIESSLKQELDIIQLERVLEKTLTVIGRMVEFRDPYTQGHQERVAQLSFDIANEMGLESELCRSIYMAGLVHDVGKIGVPLEILRKKTRLTERELELVRSHTVLGWEILKDLAPHSGIAEIVRHHHERLDGSGYPDLLDGETIPLPPRIIAVADVLDSMTSTRPYRAGRDLRVALDQLNSEKGVLYDPEVVQALFRMIQQKGYIYPPRKHRNKAHGAASSSGMESLVYQAFDGFEDQQRLDRLLSLSNQTLDSSHDDIYWVDIQGDIKFVNPAGCQLSGYSQESLVGRSLAFIAPTFLPDGWNEVWKQIRNDIAHVHSCWLQPRQGALIPVDITTSIVAFEGQDYACLFCRDTSERINHEHERDQRTWELENQLRLDELTNIPNRRALDERMDYEWRRRSRTLAPLAVLMIDIDYFKTYNDVYGHLAGDKVLKKVAHMISFTVSRAGDFVGRYGGEEFLVILPGLKEFEAALVAENIRATLEQASRVRDKAGRPKCAQVSIGVASTESAEHSPFNFEDSWQSLVAVADTALYHAKRGGRNRVVSMSHLGSIATKQPLHE